MKTKTRIDKRRMEFESNRQYIQHAVGLSDYNYNLLIYETGMLFLNQLYPEGTSFYKWLSIHERSPSFWKWWKAEWHKWEDEFLQQLEDNKVITFSPAFYGRRIVSMTNEKHIESSYQHNYLKHQNYELY